MYENKYKLIQPSTQSIKFYFKVWDRIKITFLNVPIDIQLPENEVDGL